MSGIDKFIIALPYENNGGSPQGRLLHSVKDYAADYGLTYGPYQLQSENRTYTTFWDTVTGEGFDGLYLTHTRDRSGNLWARNLVCNPTSLLTAGRMFDILSRIVGASLPFSHAIRIDVAADYRGIDFIPFISGLDVIDRMYSRIYLNTRSGLPETHYYGTANDVFLIYDKRAERIARGTPTSQTPTSLIRIERQLQSAAKIRAAFGFNITGTNLLRTLYRIAEGHFPLLSGVEPGALSFEPDRNLSRAQLRRRYVLEGLTKGTSFATARRFIASTEHRNFGRYAPCYTRTPYPPDQQPDAVLRAAVRTFLIDTRRPRRDVPPSIRALQAAA